MCEAAWFLYLLWLLGVRGKQSQILLCTKSYFVGFVKTLLCRLRTKSYFLGLAQNPTWWSFSCQIIDWNYRSLFQMFNKHSLLRQNHCMYQSVAHLFSIRCKKILHLFSFLHTIFTILLLIPINWGKNLEIAITNYSTLP